LPLAAEGALIKTQNSNNESKKDLYIKRGFL
jgi:hypothetical protein